MLHPASPGLRSPPAAPIRFGRQVSGSRYSGTPQAAPAVQEGQAETQQTFLIYCSAVPYRLIIPLPSLLSFHRITC